MSQKKLIHALFSGSASDNFVFKPSSRFSSILSDTRFRLFSLCSSRCRSSRCLWKVFPGTYRNNRSFHQSRVRFPDGYHIYCPVRMSDEMTIAKTHPTLVSSISADKFVFQMNLEPYFFFTHKFFCFFTSDKSRSLVIQFRQKRI